MRSLEETGRPRAHWRDLDPEDGQTEWIFETVEDNGERIAIKQIALHPSGAIDRYWWKHVEDGRGFLTDKPVDYTDQLDPIAAEEFKRLSHR